jgi:tetratricopeptide (TPR) repeat protein
MAEAGDGKPQIQRPAASALQARLEQGSALHRQGKLADAERICREILRQQPDHFGALHLLGVIALQTHHPERAIELIGKAIPLKPDHAEAYYNLGNALFDLKRPADAVASYDRAIALEPDFAEVHYNRGNALLDLKRLLDALASYDTAIALKPDFAEVHINRAYALLDVKRPEDALASCDRAIALKPDSAEAYTNRGLALLDLKRPEDALASCDRAIALKPDHAIAHNYRGMALLDLKRPEIALASYDRAIALKPDYAMALNYRGVALQKLKRPEVALASYDKAIALKPDFAVAYANRGITLRTLNRLDDALASYDKAIALSPNLATAYSNRGNALLDLMRPEEAIASFDTAIALKPDFAEAYWSQSLCLLLLGRFKQGWRQYEWRKKCDEPFAARSYSQPLWLGDQDIAGKTLFLWWEQGLGDTIQFCRYAMLAEARGAKIVLSVQQPLRGLLSAISPTIPVIGPDDVPEQFDYHCPLLSLPLAFGTTLATIPAQRQYLKADEDLRVALAARLLPKTRPRIGLVWSGLQGQKNDHNRSIALQRLLPILSFDADWTCLQKEIREKDLAVLRQSGRIVFFGDDLRDFSDTAALIDLMDLVITVDTSVAHLAGAMGKPVWLLLSYRHDWRWLRDRNDSPWYPSARLFRQDDTRDWDKVIERVRVALSEHFSEGRPPQ